MSKCRICDKKLEFLGGHTAQINKRNYSLCQQCFAKYRDIITGNEQTKQNSIQYLKNIASPNCFLEITEDSFISKTPTSELQKLRDKNQLKNIILTSSKYVIATTNSNSLYVAFYNSIATYLYTYQIQFDKIIQCEITENNTTVSDGWLGRAVVGDLIAGPAGAIIGASTRKSHDVITDISVHIITKDLDNPSITFKINTTNPVRGSSEHLRYQEEARKIYGAITAIVAQNKQGILNENKSSRINTASKLNELKQMLDNGLISKDEYIKMRERTLAEF